MFVKRLLLRGMIALTVVLMGCQSTPSKDTPGSVNSQQNVKAEKSSRFAKKAEEIRKFRSAAGVRADAMEEDIDRLLDPIDNPDTNFQGRFKTSLSEMDVRQKGLKSLEKHSKRSVGAVAPRYNPLDEKLISINVGNEELRSLLRILAEEAGVNLLLSPELTSQSHRLTVTFTETPISTVFEELMRITDLYGRIDGNVMRVDPLQEATFKVGFLDATLTAEFGSGGDVLGASGGKGLSGKFSVSGKGPAEKSPYERLRLMVEEVVGEDDLLVIDPMSGTLQINSKPSVVRMVAELVERFKSAEKRQILIEAQILEVTLNNDYQAGINWGALRSEFSVTQGIAQGISSLGNMASVNNPLVALGEIASGGLGSLQVGYAGNRVSALFNMLKQYGDVQVVSNPTIRAKHAVPALISVGQSLSYINSTETKTDDETKKTTSIYKTAKLFQGLMIGVVSFIHEDGHISLVVNPLKSDVNVSNQVATSAGDLITLPVVDLKSISTMLEMQSGETVMLGGLIDRSESKNQGGVPVLSDLPLIGALFTSRADSHSARELVLLLKATVL